MDDDEFESAVEDALDRIPEQLRGAIDNVAIIVQYEPDPDMLEASSTGGLLGLYEGIPLSERQDYPFDLPDRLFIFQGPLERLARDREDLVEQIEVTVIHEVAHYFGIEDDELDELGWG